MSGKAGNKRATSSKPKLEGTGEAPPVEATDDKPKTKASKTKDPKPQPEQDELPKADLDEGKKQENDHQEPSSDAKPKKKASSKSKVHDQSQGSEKGGMESIQGSQSNLEKPASRTTSKKNSQIYSNAELKEPIDPKAKSSSGSKA